MKKRIISIIMVVIMLFAVCSISVSAATKRTVYLNSNRGWSSDITVTMNKNVLGKAKSGSVRAYMANWGVNVDIRMKNSNNKVIWSQNNAIKASSKVVATIYRDFSLGNDNSVYKLSFRTSKKCAAAPYVRVESLKNCKVS